MITMDKQYQTRDGRPVRLLCVDGPTSTHPVIGIYNNKIECWTEHGHYSFLVEHDFDLIEVKQTKTIKSLCWRNKDSGYLLWRDTEANLGDEFQRFPAGDIEGKVEVEVEGD